MHKLHTDILLLLNLMSSLCFFLFVCLICPPYTLMLIHLFCFFTVHCILIKSELYTDLLSPQPHGVAASCSWAAGRVMRLSADVSPPVPDSQGQPQPHTDPAEDRPTEGTNRKQIHGSRVFYHADNSREHQIHITDERPKHGSDTMEMFLVIQRPSCLYWWQLWMAEC